MSVPVRAVAEYDFHLYGRQSDPKKFGNESTGLQGEDLLREVVEAFRIVDPTTADNLFTYDVETMTGLDSGVRVDYGRLDDGKLEIEWPRNEFARACQTMIARYRATRRTQVLCVYMLNRLARSLPFLVLLDNVIRATHGHFRVWSARDGGMIDPDSAGGLIQIVVQSGVTGRQESVTKSNFVRDSARRIFEHQPTRSLGEKIVGYRHERVKVGNKWQVFHVRDETPHAALQGLSQVEIVRRIFEMYDEGLRPVDITRRLNTDLGVRHPHRNKPWVWRTVWEILNDSIYVGRRVRGKYRVPYIGERPVRTPDHERIECQYSEELRIIDDALWQRVQNRIKARSTVDETGTTKGAKRGPKGRPPARTLYFAQSKMLKCAVCGHSLSAHRLSGAKGTYEYVCGFRRQHYGQFGCQAHDADALDEALDAQLIEAFKDFPMFAEVLERELAHDTTRQTRDALAKQVQKQETIVGGIEDQMFDPEFSSEARARLRERYNTEVKRLGKLKAKLDMFGATEDVRQRKWQIARARHLAQYSTMSKELRKAAQREFFDAVWVWPDGALWVQRKGVKVDLSERPVYRAGREIGFGLDWPLLDAERIRADLLRIMKASKLGPSFLARALPSSNTARRLLKPDTKVGLGVLVRAYHHALTNAPTVPEDVYRPDYLGDMAMWVAANAGKCKTKRARFNLDKNCDTANLTTHFVQTVSFEEFRELVMT